MAKTTIDQDFKVTIPKSAREALGFNIGDKVESVTSEDGVMFRPNGIVATPEEKRVITRGQKEYEKGEYVTLKQHLREMDAVHNKIGAKRAPKNR
jgi:AbrB family looped-hinge helix DNA binding protein